MGIPDFLDREELAELKRLAALYVQTKALVLYCEEVDPDSSSNLQIIKELRDAFDHTMRSFVHKFDGIGKNLNPEENLQYTKSHLDKAVGHVYRAAFDALDGTVLSLKIKIAKELDGYEAETIKIVMPNYWDIKKRINTLAGKVASHRETKDIKAEKLSETFENYVTDVDFLKKDYDEILENGPAIEELHKEKKKGKNFSYAMFFVISVFSAIVGSLSTCALIPNQTSANIPRGEHLPIDQHLEHNDKKPARQQNLW